MSHTGGALPYQSGRMDKNSRPRSARNRSAFIQAHVHRHGVAAHRRHAVAIDYYGIDNGCTARLSVADPAPCSKLWKNVRLSEADKQKLFYSNARRILGLKDPAPSKTAAQREPALA